MTKYMLITRNNASAKNACLFVSSDSEDKLRVILDANLDGYEDGEYQYAVIPFYGSEEYAAAIEIEYMGNLLDSVIHCPDGSIEVKDLHPQTGIMLIGDATVTENISDEDAGSGYNKIYLYDEDN